MVQWQAESGRASVENGGENLEDSCFKRLVLCCKMLSAGGVNCASGDCGEQSSAPLHTLRAKVRAVSVSSNSSREGGA
jgi:hypothetical protein